MKTRRICLLCVTMFVGVFAFAQKQRVTLQFCPVENLRFPCIPPFDDCMDTSFVSQDTLFLIFEDKRGFFRDSVSDITIVLEPDGYIKWKRKQHLFKHKTKNITYEYPIVIREGVNMDNIVCIVVRLYDYSFSLKKEKENVYKCINTTETKDYSNKQWRSLEESGLDIRH